MKRLSAALGTLLILTSLGVSAQRQNGSDMVFTEKTRVATRRDSSDVDRIARMDQQLFRSLQLREDAGLDRIAADSFIFVSPRGEIIRRSAWLDDVKSGDFYQDIVSSFNTEGEASTRTAEPIFRRRFQVRLFGDTAIALGTATLEVRQRTRSVTEYRYFATPVYIKQAGDWRLAYLQLSVRGHRGDRDPFTGAADAIQESGTTTRRGSRNNDTRRGDRNTDSRNNRGNDTQGRDRTNDSQDSAPASDSPSDESPGN